MVISDKKIVLSLFTYYPSSTSLSSQVSTSTAHRHSARLCLCKRRACAAYASRHTPGPTFVCLSLKQSASSDIAECFLWSSDVRLSRRSLRAKEIQLGAKSPAQKRSFVPARLLCNRRRRHPSVLKTLRSHPESRCLPKRARVRAEPLDHST